MWYHLVCSTSVVCLPTTLMTLCSPCLCERYLNVNEEAAAPLEHRPQACSEDGEGRRLVSGGRGTVELSPLQ